MSLSDSKQQQLRSYYYDVLGGGKFEKTWKRVQREFPDVYTRKQVREFVENQASTQETKTFKRKPSMFSSIRAKKPGDIYQIDLMFFSGGRVGQYAGVLNVVDVYSRFAWSELIKSDPKPKNHKQGTPWRMTTAGGKGQTSVLNAFKKIIRRSGGRTPKHINMDEGNEFTNRNFLAYLQQIGAEPHYSNKYTFMKNPIVERFNRTLREALREQEATGTTRYKAVIEKLPQIMKNYNRDVHSTIKERPIDVWRGRARNRQKLKNKRYDFEEGESVRILERQSDYAKSGKYKWSKEIYTIYDVQVRRNHNRYFVSDSDGQLTFVDKADKQEKPAWFMGYQLQRLGSKGKAERSADYDAKQAARQQKMKETKKAKAKSKRALAKEGLDAVTTKGAVTRKTRKKRVTDWQQLVGKRIAVKWNSAGQVLDNNPVFTFYSGKVTKYNPQNKRHTIKYDDTGETLPLNLADPRAAKYVKQGNWKQV
jgi:hypothetical protein